jgi:hypothetical protein
MRSITCAVIALGLFITATSNSSAQTDYSNRLATSSLTVGPTTIFGASMIIDPAKGSKVSPIFSYKLSADATFPLTPVISAGLGLGYESRGTKIRAESNADIFTTTRLSYFTIYPNFGFSSFRIGLNMGLPLGGSFTSKFGAGTTEVVSDLTSSQQDSVEFLLEPRIGATVVLMEDKTGWLGLVISAGFSLNEMVNRGDVSALGEDAGDFHMVSGHIGVTYQFTIPGTKRK